ncbi:MAG: selenocysteine-specific elongation factor [Chloroflexi bacterium]|nr:MAG: selenocysteine-specific elongation factor [Chloroflexota bacterium]
MFVIGTAGHVDHGKSLLVQAMTGINPDRLKEEKKRGMTIDLGFASLTLPSGREVSLIDVPGHERFISNMLAGVGGIDIALLVIAADESVMPQTLEHLTILKILKINRVIVAVSKSDLVDDDWLRFVVEEISSLLKEANLETVPIVPTSAVTGEGLEKLLVEIDRAIDQTSPSRNIGLPRLPVDRSFVIPGFGSVVTGTLIDGELSVGNEVQLILANKKARVRGLQTHGKNELTVKPGTRLAVNLSGISHQDIRRGDLLTYPGWLQPTKSIDVELHIVSAAPRPLKHNSTVMLHLATTETLARILLLEDDQIIQGGTSWAQLRLEQPVAAVKGDYFVIRSSRSTLGGGSVIETHANRHKRNDSITLKRLSALRSGSSKEILLASMERLGVINPTTLAQEANLSLADTNDILDSLIGSGIVQKIPSAKGKTVLLMSTDRWNTIKDRIASELEKYHKLYPLRAGVSREEVKRLPNLPLSASEAVINKLVTEKTLFAKEHLISLPSHTIHYSKAENTKIDLYLHQLESTPYSPPNDNAIDSDLVKALIEEGKVIRVSDNIVFTAKAYNNMVDQIVRHLNTEGKITVAQVRDLFKTSRKYAIALMEHLDQQRVTRRMGDDRVLR